MQAHKLEVLVIDFDQLGAEGVKNAICTARYPNHCISPSVEAIQTVEIGPWSDDHPLNNSKTCEAEYKRLFERTTSPVSQLTDEQIVDEQQKALKDMLIYGAAFTVGGKHVPLETVIMFSSPEVTSTAPHKADESGLPG